MDNFIAVMGDGTIIGRESLNELAKYYFAEYYFKKEVSSTQSYKNQPSSVFYSYRYTPIDIAGNPIIIKAGDFELIEIEPDNIDYSNFRHRFINFYDHKKECIRVVKSVIGETDFLFKEFRYTVKLLTTVNDWEVFIKIKDYDSVIIENNKLKDENEKLTRLNFALSQKINQIESIKS